MKQITLVLLFLSLCVTGLAQTPGGLDQTYGVIKSGKVLFGFGNNPDVLTAFVANQNQTLGVGYTTYNGNTDFAVNIYGAGGYDPKIGLRKFDFSGGQDYCMAAALGTNTAFLAGYTINSGNTSCAAAKITQGGAFDQSFGVQGKLVFNFGGTDDRLMAVAVQTDGKVIFAGYTTNGSNKDFALCRYTQAGTLDATFGTNGKIITNMGGIDIIKAIKLQTDGKIIVAGTSTTASNSDFAVARYTSTGVLDTSFNTTGKLVAAVGSDNDYVNAVNVYLDKIVVVGSAFNGSNLDVAMMMLTSAGQIDTAFGNQGRVITPIGPGDDEATGVIELFGTFLLTGYTHSGTDKDALLIRYQTSGTLTTNFGVNGKVITNVGPGDDVAIGVYRNVSENRLYVGGNSYNGEDNDFLFAEFSVAGVLDTQIGYNGITRVDFERCTLFAHSVVQQIDNKILIGGSYRAENSAVDNFDISLARFNTDGSLDTTFSNDGRLVMSLSSQTDMISALTILPDNRILAAVSRNDEAVFLKFNVNGTLDTAFGSNGIQTIPASYIDAIKVLQDNKILIYGADNNNIPIIIKYNANLTLDNSFGSNGKFLLPQLANQRLRVNNIVIQPDNKIIIGAGGTPGGTANNYFKLARVNANGSLDTTFGESGTGYISTYINTNLVGLSSLILQPDGKILAGGNSGNTGDIAVVVRYTSAGLLDATFGTAGKFILDTSLEHSTGRLILQPDGKILFTGAHGGDGLLLFRINANGTLDSTDYYVLNHHVSVNNDDDHAVGAILNGNKLYIGGYSSGQYYNFILARINLGNVLSIDEVNQNEAIVKTVIYPNPVKDKVILRIQRDVEDNASVELYDIRGKRLTTPNSVLQLQPGNNEYEFKLPANLIEGNYFLMIKSSKGIESIKLVK